MTTENTDISVTTSDAKDTAASQDDTQPKKRSVAELISLGTYQGMTDEEIQSIIDFEKNLAEQNGRIEALKQTDIVTMNEIIESNRTAQQHSEEVLKSVLTVPLKLATIDTEGVVSNGS